MTASRTKIRWFGLSLLIVLVLLLAPANRAFASAQTLNYRDIEDLVLKNNIQLQIVNQTYRLLADSRSSMEDMEKEMGTMETSLSRLSSNLGALANQNASNPEIYAGLLAMQGVVMINQMSLTTISYDSIDMQIEQTRIQIEQTEKTLVNSAQNIYVMYHQMENQMQQMRLSRELLEESLRLAQVQVATGAGTQLDVLQAELAIAEFDSNYATLESSVEQLVNNLKLLLGWAQNEGMRIGSLPAPNRSFLDNISLTEDIASAIANNYSLKLSQQEYNYNEDSHQQYIMRLNMDLTREQIELYVRNQYVAIQQSISTLELEEQRLTVLEEQLAQIRRQAELGLVSAVELQSMETNYENQATSVETAKINLFWEIEYYNAMIAGLI